MSSTLKRALRTKGSHFIEEARTLSNVAIPHKTDRKDKHKLTTLNLDSPYFKTAKAAAGLFASLEDMKAFSRLAFVYRSDLLSTRDRRPLFTSILENKDLEPGGHFDLPAPLKEVVSWYCLGWRKIMVKNKPESTLLFTRVVSQELIRLLDIFLVKG